MPLGLLDGVVGALLLYVDNLSRRSSDGKPCEPGREEPLPKSQGETE